MANDIIMEHVYHYTSICKDCESVLASILHPDKIDLRATYFEKFGSEDYLWIKKHSESIVKELCTERGVDYDNDFYATLPYIISFCTNPDSEYMWERYGNKRRGMMLEFNKDILLQTCHDHEEVDGTIHEDLDCFTNCMYVSDKNGIPNIKEIKQSILEYANNINNHNKWNLLERLRLAIAAIKRSEPFSKEEEWRYMTLHDVIMNAKPDPNNEGGCIISDSKVSHDEWYKHVEFPKKALTSITVGDEASDYCFQCVRNYVMKCGFSPNIVRQRKKGIDSQLSKNH